MLYKGVLWNKGKDFTQKEARTKNHGYFCKDARITFLQAFKKAAHCLPTGASLSFGRRDKHNITWIIPFSGQEKPLLIYTHYPEHSSVRINNIQAGADKKSGLGTNMIHSQIPFWNALRVRHIAVFTHNAARGFYEKLGFEQVEKSPEHGEIRLTGKDDFFMRLDLQSEKQRAVFDRALLKAVEKSTPLPRRHAFF